jgi:lysozyme family protein
MSVEGFERYIFNWLLLKQNDGQPLHDTPGDAGGWTAWGITLAAFTAWRTGQGLPAPGALDLGRVSRDELLAFYHAGYWLPAAGDRLPIGDDAVACDIAVMSGPGIAARLMRRVTGQPPGYAMDLATIGAALALGPISLMLRLGQAHNQYDGAIVGGGQFKGGWSNRVAGLQAVAAGWIKNGAPAPDMALADRLFPPAPAPIPDAQPAPSITRLEAAVA